MHVKTFPHEFLARWGRDGKLQGYHVITVDILCDDTTGLPVKKNPTNPESENYLETFNTAQTLTEAGVTLEEILSHVQSAALAQVDNLQGQLAALQASTQAERDALQVQVQALQSALDAATPADPTAIQAQVRAIVPQELADARAEIAAIKG